MWPNITWMKWTEPMQRESSCSPRAKPSRPFKGRWSSSRLKTIPQKETSCRARNKGLFWARDNAEFNRAFFQESNRTPFFDPYNSPVSCSKHERRILQGIERWDQDPIGRLAGTSQHTTPRPFGELYRALLASCLAPLQEFL